MTNLDTVLAQGLTVKRLAQNCPRFWAGLYGGMP